ncbi:hypothetical protein [Asticcacaulis sp. 201]|uniref:hypothetical protein n=1 Tax=Asticcacaulis sp. 201 TaxID=3028787 RepID=UPI0029164AA7|nr:hypothetical protein [Asticcacaulis sp. 201]MDV6331707.1 hypothetical protein [Asticcacaulis sp. 201]
MPDQYSDRRSEPRQARDDTGVLLFLSDNQIINCRILDSSATGARVAMEALSHIPSEIWLIDLNSQMVKRGSAAWSMANRMGLKFNFIQKLAPGDARPAKVPQEVYDAWLRVTNGPAQATPEAPKPEEPGDDVLYFD